MPCHRHLNRAVWITYGLCYCYRWNELNHECGLPTECTQNFRSQQTHWMYTKIQNTTERAHYIFQNRMTMYIMNDKLHIECWKPIHFRIQRELTARLHQTFICELLLQLCLHQQKTSEAGVCLPSHLRRSYRCWWCWNHLNSDRNTTWDWITIEQHTRLDNSTMYRHEKWQQRDLYTRYCQL